MISKSKPANTHADGRATAPRPATLSDVAKIAGVAAMTASRAINGSGYVSESVRHRVLKAAKQLQYRPNLQARQLKSGSLSAIGVLLPDIANPFSTELVRGMKQVFDAAGYTTFLSINSQNVEREKSSLQAFVDHRVDGLIVATRGTTRGNEILKAITRHGIPAVTIGRPTNLRHTDSVTADHFQGAFDAVTHLIALGHSRIGFIGIAPEDRHSLRRYEGYAAALQQAGIGIHDAYIVGPRDAPAFATQEDGFAGLTHLAHLQQPPSAVFARNDFTAIGALRAAQTLALRVPQDIAIVGFDNIPLSAFTTPPLTTVEQPIAEQGAAAATLLLDRIEGRYAGPARKLTMPCRLVVRESSLAPPIIAPIVTPIVAPIVTPIVARKR